MIIINDDPMQSATMGRWPPAEGGLQSATMGRWPPVEGGLPTRQCSRRLAK